MKTVELLPLYSGCPLKCQKIQGLHLPNLTLLHSEQPKLHRVLAALSAIELKENVLSTKSYYGKLKKLEGIMCSF